MQKCFVGSLAMSMQCLPSQVQDLGKDQVQCGRSELPVAEERVASPTVPLLVVSPAATAMMQGWCAPTQVSNHACNSLLNSMCPLLATKHGGLVVSRMYLYNQGGQICHLGLKGGVALSATLTVPWL